MKPPGGCCSCKSPLLPSARPCLCPAISSSVVWSSSPSPPFGPLSATSGRGFSPPYISAWSVPHRPHRVPPPQPFSVSCHLYVLLFPAIRNQGPFPASQGKKSYLPSSWGTPKICTSPLSSPLLPPREFPSFLGLSSPSLSFLRSSSLRVNLEGQSSLTSSFSSSLFPPLLVRALMRPTGLLVCCLSPQLFRVSKHAVRRFFGSMVVDVVVYPLVRGLCS